jgi:hypothetical protein
MSTVLATLLGFRMIGVNFAGKVCGVEWGRRVVAETSLVGVGDRGACGPARYVA